MANIDKILGVYNSIMDKTGGDGLVVAVLTAAAIMEEAKDAILLQTKATKELCLYSKRTSSTLHEIDLDEHLERIANNVANMDKTIFNTLASTKVDSALESISELSHIVEELV